MHRRQRDVDLLIVAVVIPAANLRRYANHLKPVPIHRDKRAQRRPPRKQQLDCSSAPAPPPAGAAPYHPHSETVPARSAGAESPDSSPQRPSPEPPALENSLTCFRSPAIDKRRRIANMLALGANRLRIAQRQLVRPASPYAGSATAGIVPPQQHDHVRRQAPPSPCAARNEIPRPAQSAAAATPRPTQYRTSSGTTAAYWLRSSGTPERRCQTRRAWQ